jgi:hypothetical protein
MKQTKFYPFHYKVGTNKHTVDMMQYKKSETKYAAQITIEQIN